MPRTIGSPNQEYRWEFIMYDPTKSDKIILVQNKYTSIKQMHECMKEYFTLSQLTSYASKSRNCPKFIRIQRI